jgi:hypothetical protein
LESAAAAVTKVLPDPPMALTHCTEGAKSAARVILESAKSAIMNDVLCTGRKLQ